MEREKLMFGDNSYNVYVGGVGLSLQRNCRVRLRYYCTIEQLAFKVGTLYKPKLCKHNKMKLSI